MSRTHSGHTRMVFNVCLRHLTLSFGPERLYWVVLIKFQPNTSDFPLIIPPNRPKYGFDSLKSGF